MDGKAKLALSHSSGIFASKRLFDIFAGFAEMRPLLGKCLITDKIEETMSRVRESEGEIAVLASGDPLFFGIARRILEAIPAEEVEVHPALSSVQLAFARIRETWEDAFFLSLHGGREREWAIEDLPLLSDFHQKLAILTGGGNTPGKICELLPADANVFILERLGYEDEKVFRGKPKDFSGREFREPNLIIVKALKSGLPVLGLRGGEFEHARGLITKDEVRAVALHKLRLPGSGVLWDIGAGSGSVSIEAKRLSPLLKVYAIDKDAARAGDIRVNINRLSAGSVIVVEGEAPGALSGLPAPDRVFIGGSGERLADIVGHVTDVMRRGVIVIAAATIETLGEATEALGRCGIEAEIVNLSVSRAEPVGRKRFMKAMNPVFLIRGEK
jgi:precorrin-6Y C5,15-methyltransferase (decarboxylating)